MHSQLATLQPGRALGEVLVEPGRRCRRWRGRRRSSRSRPSSPGAGTRTGAAASGTLDWVMMLASSRCCSSAMGIIALSRLFQSGCAVGAVEHLAGLVAVDAVDVAAGPRRVALAGQDHRAGQVVGERRARLPPLPPTTRVVTAGFDVAAVALEYSVATAGGAVERCSGRRCRGTGWSRSTRPLPAAEGCRCAGRRRPAWSRRRSGPNRPASFLSGRIAMSRPPPLTQVVSIDAWASLIGMSPRMATS